MTNAIDQYQERITFFEKSSETKDQIVKSENERLKLEIELNKLLNSDQAVARAKAVKLKEYYKKLCDDEAHSLKRNQQLLFDLQRVDSQFQQLETKLERLSNLKKECEVYLRTAHPIWTNENKLFPNENPTDLHTNSNKNFEIISNSLANINNQINQSAALKKSYYQELDNQMNQVNQNYNEPSAISALLNAFKMKTQNINEVPYEFSIDKGDSPHKYNVLQNLVTSHTSAQNEPHIIPQESKSSPQIKTKTNEFIGQLAMASFKINPEQPLQQNNLLNNLNINDTLLKEYERELKRQDTNVNENTLVNTVSSLNFMNPLYSTSIAENQQIEQILAENQKNSDLKNWPSSPIVTHGLNDYYINGKILDDKPNEQINSLRQELTISALYNLLDYIEAELKSTIHPEKYYRQVESHYKNKLEIIKFARENKALNEMDPAEVSMVVIDQLPVIIRKHTQEKCLFTSDLMGLSVADINDIVVNYYLKDKNDKELWNRLLKHWNYLKRFASIDSQKLASIFAPTLLGAYSYGTEKAITFLEKILNHNSLQDVLGESKSLTETSINQELILASSSKLKESSAYQEFIMNTTQTSNKSFKKKHDDDDENDEIDALIAPKTPTGIGNLKNYAKASSIIKSPRGTGEYEFDFSQNSFTESQKKVASLKHSARSSKDKKIPAHLRDLDSSDNDSSESTTENTHSKLKSKSQKSDSDFDFYQ